MSILSPSIHSRAESRWRKSILIYVCLFGVLWHASRQHKTSLSKNWYEKRERSPSHNIEKVITGSWNAKLPFFDRLRWQRFRRKYFQNEAFADAVVENGGKTTAEKKTSWMIQECAKPRKQTERFDAGNKAIILLRISNERISNPKERIFFAILYFY